MTNTRKYTHIPVIAMSEPQIAQLDFLPGESVQIIATVNRVQADGDLVVYFGDQDEDEFVYSPNEVRKVDDQPELAELRTMADVDLSTEGDWSADTANERCARYAALVAALKAP